MATPPSSPVQEAPPQADPIPTKRGEFGFRESLHAVAAEATISTDGVQSLPLRHPADRDPSRSPTASRAPASSASSTSHPTPLRTLFRPKKLYASGIRSSTIFLLIFQFVLLLITIASWVLLIKLAASRSTLSLMIHVVFALLILFQLIFLERTTFKLRAERYATLHPGEVIPSNLLHPNQTSSRLALAPWNRPPLPSYAAVIMDSGAVTGDVEDNQIAIPPPPAYGITRGSKLVLTGFISPELRNESRRVRAERGESLSIMTEQSASRPISVISQDSLEARCDGTRARILEVTLSRLQNAEVSTTRT